MAEDRHVTYADSGVDVDEGARAVDAIKDAVKATNRPEVIGDLGGFGGLFSASALKNMEDPVLVSGTDGVGTKLALAQRLNRNTTVGQDLVAMCADDIVVLGAEPLFFLDYVAIGHIKAESMADIVSGIAEGCRLAGCALVGGEMAEHPGVMNPDDYDLAGFCVGVVDRPRVLGPERVQEGDVILGIPSSGIHSNGYSLVRKALTNELTYKQLEEPRAELGGESLADALLRPTAIYAGKLTRVLRAGAPIHAMAHITGGGITENLNRALPPHLDALVNRGGSEGMRWATVSGRRADRALPGSEGCSPTPAWDVPPIINCIIDAAGLTPDEAYKTFNMGVGMSVICAPQDAENVAKMLDDEGLSSFVMGECIAGKGTVCYR